MQSSKQLSAIAVANINRRGINFVGGVRGLGINVAQSGSKSWILRYQIGGKRRDMGLGGYSDISLAAARDLARSARIKLAQGIDPVSERRAKREDTQRPESVKLTFLEAASKYIAAHESSWKSSKHGQQWRNTIHTYALPLADLPVQEITSVQVLEVLDPIWRTKTETATRLRSRIELILDWSIARGHREAPNPARWKGHLDKLLPAPAKVAKKAHHPALPYADMPEFFRRLQKQPGLGARALELLILTATRSGELRGARWNEIDEDSATWTIPASRMKAGKEHRVPLSTAALELLHQQRETSTSELIFPGARYGKPLSDMTLSSVLRRMEEPFVPHGFRSSFRDWAAEETDYSNEIQEMALAHAVSNRVEAAYRRGDLLEKRRNLMRDWGAYITSTSKA
jgi:integrase